MALVRIFLCALGALVLLGLAACSDGVIGDPPICGVPPVPFPAPVIPQNSGLMKVGQRFTLLISPSSPSPCDSGAIRPTSVTAEIEGPGGEPLEGQIQLGTDSSPATLHFTPVRPGPHHILVAFSQVGGIHQFDFHAVMDNSTTAPSITLNKPCTSLQRTQKGLWVCNSEVVRDDATEVGSFNDSRVAVAGDVIWVVGPTLIRRYVDRGGILALEGFMDHALGEATSLLPSPEELLVVHLNGSMALYTFNGGTVTSAGPTSWSRSYAMMGNSGPYGLLLRDGNQLGLVSLTNVNSQSVAQVCPYQLVSGRLERVTGSCTVLGGDVVGFEPRVLWTRDPPSLLIGRVDQGALHRWEWIGGRLVEQGSVALGVNARLIFPTMLAPANVPVIVAEKGGSFSGDLTAVAVWSAERRTLLFEHLDAEMSSANASPTFYWGLLPSTSESWTTKVRVRPQAAVP